MQTNQSLFLPNFKHASIARRIYIGFVIKCNLPFSVHLPLQTDQDLPECSLLKHLLLWCPKRYINRDVCLYRFRPLNTVKMTILLIDNQYLGVLLQNNSRVQHIAAQSTAFASKMVTLQHEQNMIWHVVHHYISILSSEPLQITLTMHRV